MNYLIPALLMVVALASVVHADVTPEEAENIDRLYREQARTDKARLADALMKSLRAAGAWNRNAAENLAIAKGHFANAGRKSEMIRQAIPEIVKNLDDARDDVKTTTSKIGEWEQMADLPKNLFEGVIDIAKSGAGGMFGFGPVIESIAGGTGATGLAALSWWMGRRKGASNPIALAANALLPDGSPPSSPAPRRPAMQTMSGEDMIGRDPTNSGTYDLSGLAAPSNGKGRR